MNRKILKFVVIISIIMTGVLLLRHYGLDEYVTLANITNLRQNIDQYGYWGPFMPKIIFMALQILNLPPILFFPG
ncbi:hypothetical protein C8C77_11955 [Halanaerobium saccharolyticum]|uniref:Uncharacterized protein n=1 Tax=Halanaerobium saccharolyticum TaxID=43595 RepID=A0A4R7YX29_9FIRM|nr:hypothetical protein [Halanaerobium saccharolyticum]RAK06964.1 hypothetical protein C7958_11855 [Halanaerobium saccharolyticum]TDW01691.1 hypothetical protein C8C77_11955 [Halanaerobium saccharolyticum]TDX53089.1 hypothetical protein C7956_11955 [Halanaerobium saccharolyticum]